MDSYVKRHSQELSNKKIPVQETPMHYPPLLVNLLVRALPYIYKVFRSSYIKSYT